MINCCMCPTDSESFSSVDDLEAHVAAEHFDCVPFECERCRFSKYPTEFAIKRHFEQDHGMTEYYVSETQCGHFLKLYRILCSQYL